MPLVAFTFEAGPNGGAVTTANSGVNIVSSPSGTVTYDSAQKEAGSFSAKMVNGANQQALVRTLAAAGSSTMSFSFAFRTPATNTGWTAGLQLQSLRHSAGASMRFMLSSTYMLYVTDAANGNNTNVHQLAASTWYRVSGWVVVGGSGTNLSLNVYGPASNTPLNGSPVTASGWNAGTAAIVGGDSGIVSLPTSSTTMWVDNVQWSNGVAEHLAAYQPENQPPTVSAGADQQVATGATVNLASTAVDPDGTIASRLWTAVSYPGSAPTITGATSANASFTAAAAGTYVMRITVTDDRGATASDDVSIVASATVPATLSPLPNLTTDSLATVTLEAAVASGTPDSYQWRQVSGPTVELTGAGDTREFIAPASLDASTVVIGVAPVVGGVTGTEVTSTVTVRPHTMWVRSAGAWVWAAWRPSVPMFNLAPSAYTGLYDLTPGGTKVTKGVGSRLYDIQPGGGLTEDPTYDGLYTGV